MINFYIFVCYSEKWGFEPLTLSWLKLSQPILLCRIFWESKSFEGHTDKVEPWYGTAYSIEKITASTIEVCVFWENCWILDWIIIWTVFSLHFGVSYDHLYCEISWKEELNGPMYVCICRGGCFLLLMKICIFQLQTNSFQLICHLKLCQRKYCIFSTFM